MTTARDLSIATINSIEQWFDHHIETCAACIRLPHAHFCSEAESKLRALRTIIQERPEDRQ